MVCQYRSLFLEGDSEGWQRWIRLRQCRKLPEHVFKIDLVEGLLPFRICRNDVRVVLCGKRSKTVIDRSASVGTRLPEPEEQEVLLQIRHRRPADFNQQTASVFHCCAIIGVIPLIWAAGLE